METTPGVGMMPDTASNLETMMQLGKLAANKSMTSKEARWMRRKPSRKNSQRCDCVTLGHAALFSWTAWPSQPKTEICTASSQPITEVLGIAAHGEASLQEEEW